MKAALVFLAFCLWWGLHILLSLCQAAKRESCNSRPQQKEWAQNVMGVKFRGSEEN